MPIAHLTFTIQWLDGGNQSMNISHVCWNIKSYSSLFLHFAEVIDSVCPSLYLIWLILFFKIVSSEAEPIVPPQPQSVQWGGFSQMAPAAPTPAPVLSTYKLNFLSL